MKFKFRSWHIVLLGILLQASFGLIIISGSKTAEGLGGIALVIGGLLILFISALGVIPLLLLLFQKTRKFGAILAILFGIIGLVSKGGIPIGVLLIAAGILSLWKKI